MTCRSSGTEDTLITLRPRLPSSSLRPPVALKGLAAGRATDSFFDGAALCQRSTPSAEASPVMVGMLANSWIPPARTVATSACIRPAPTSSPITKPGPPAAWNSLTSAVPFG